MEVSDFKFPTTQEEYDALKKSLRSEISDDEVEAVTGGNDNSRKNKKKNGILWTCPGCGATIMVYQLQDCSKHATKCPGNPFK